MFQSTITFTTSQGRRAGPLALSVPLPQFAAFAVEDRPRELCVLSPVELDSVFGGASLVINIGQRVEVLSMRPSSATAWASFVGRSSMRKVFIIEVA